MSLAVNHSSFAYHNSKALALNDFSYTFVPGVFYGIFGANGSGKSTLLKLLAGDIAGDSSVLLDDRPLRQIPHLECARLIAYAAQEEELPLPFTVEECIALGRYAWPDKEPALIDQLLKKWNAEYLRGKSFTGLSGGERQKVKLLRILAQNTRYILLDEPASSLDFAKQLELYENLQQIAHRENKAVIMVCHDLYIAPAFIDEMLLMQKGQLVYSGNPDTQQAASTTAQAFDRNFKISRSIGKVEISW